MSQRGTRNVRKSRVNKSLQRQAAKERSRVAKEVVKLQALQSGDRDPHVQELYQQLNALVTAHNDLVVGTNQNFALYNNSIQQLDARLGAAFSAVQDIVDSLGQAGKNGVSSYTTSLRTTVVAVDGVESVRVDWPSYIKDHLDMVKAEMLRLQADKEAIESNLKTTEETLFTPPTKADAESDEDEPTVFGGDHAQAQQQLSST